MQTLWQVHERGSEGGIWKLTQQEKLTVGRSKECRIVLASQSVDGSHAVVEWNNKQEAFIIRDLGSVNGTYHNNQPVRGGVATLCHGDSLRFGYEKSRVFRVEEVCLPSCPTDLPPQQLTPSSSVTTQTSPQAPPMTAPPITTPGTMVGQSSQHMLPTTPQHTPVTIGGGQAQAQLVSGIQYIPMPGQPLMYHSVQSPLHMPYVVAQPPLHYGYPPPSSPISVAPHILMPSGSVPPPSPPVTVPPQVFMSLPNSPNPVIQSEVMTTPTNDHRLYVGDIENESSEKGSARSDGRRSVELSNSPHLSSASKLYGKPTWWGEKDGEEVTNTEFEFVKPGTQILRDLEPQTKAPEDDGSNSPRGVRLSAKDELRMQAITNSIAQDKDPNSSWVIDFGGGAMTKPKRPHRPRSADPSPNRSPHVRDVSPAARGTRRSISPAARRMTVSTSSVSPGNSPIHRSATISKKKELETSSSSGKKPPAGSLPRSKTIRGKPKVQRSDQRRRSLEGLKSNAKLSHDSPSGAHDHPAASKTKSKQSASKTQNIITVSHGNSNETYTIASPSQDSEQSTEVNSEPKGERPNSARKQWSNGEPQPPDSLMLASIEARMRRLSKMAHSVAIHVTSLKRSLLLVGAVTTQDHTSFEPFCTNSTTSSSEHSMPEWKFFNKEVDSIFRSVRATERWLKDINNTVNTIQPVGGAAPAGGVDHPSIEVESEGECFQDSIDTLSCTSDDTYVKSSDL